MIGKGPPVVKVCLSSRPLVVFKGTFSECPQLELQNLAFNDITNYANDKFGSNTAFKRLRTRDPKSSALLSEQVVEKADGDFLWIWIVIKESKIF